MKRLTEIGGALYFSIPSNTSQSSFKTHLWFPGGWEDATTWMDRLWRLGCLIITWKYVKDCQIWNTAAGNFVICIPPPWLDRLGIQKSVISSNQVVVLIQITLVLKRKQGDFREWLYQIKEDKHKVIFMKQLVLCKWMKLISHFYYQVVDSLQSFKGYLSNGHHQYKLCIGLIFIYHYHE